MPRLQFLSRKSAKSTPPPTPPPPSSSLPGQSRIEDLPTEIIEKFAKYACTDDGETGRSLSLVSTRIKDATMQYKYQSIVIAGPRQMFKFDSVLKAVDPKYMKIRHLMIASMEQQNERDRHNPNYVAPDHSLNAPYGETYQAFLRIMTVASQTAVNLKLVTDMMRSNHVIAINFPNLVEFTIHAPFGLLGDSPNPHSEIVRLHKLRHLCVMGFTSFPSKVMKEVGEVAPGLTHLTILPNVGLPPIANQLELGLGLPCRAYPRPEPYIPLLPSTIQKIYIGPGPPPVRGSFTRQQRDMMARIHRLSQTDPRIVLLEPRKVLPFHKAKLQWLDNHASDSLHDDIITDYGPELQDYEATQRGLGSRYW